MSRLLRHESLLIRFLALYGLGLALFLFAWVISYRFLPEGVLRGRTGAALLAGETASESFTLEFLRIAAVNLAVTLFFVALPNRLLLVSCVPLGYFPPLFWCLIYGVMLGTNSFTIPLAGRIAPSLEILTHSGLYEIAAYALAAVSTHNVAILRSPGLFSLKSEPVEPRPNWRKNTQWIGLGSAVLLLLASSAWEAYQIVFVR